MTSYSSLVAQGSYYLEATAYEPTYFAPLDFEPRGRVIHGELTPAEIRVLRRAWLLYCAQKRIRRVLLPARAQA